MQLKKERAKNYIRKWDQLIDNTYIRIIRDGLIMASPFIIAGAFALMLVSLPISVYQRFLTGTEAGRVIGMFFRNINHVTYGFLAVLISITLGMTIRNEMSRVKADIHFLPLVVTCCFLLSVGALNEGFDLASLGAAGVFMAIVNASVCATFYIGLCRRIRGLRIFSDGSTPVFDRAFTSLPAIVLTFLTFSVMDYLLCRAFHADSVWQLSTRVLRAIFDHLGAGFWGGLVYVVITMVLWFFGIHGANVMESANSDIFIPHHVENILAAQTGRIPPHICTKTFIDTFVLMGGCGTTLCLVLAIILVGRRKNNRLLAKTSLFPMIFNINEVMVFGLPIVYNLIFVIPFILCPLLCYLISYGAVAVGLVPRAAAEVQWTTPVFISGYRATGNAAGVLLQLFELVMGTMIYLPFFKMYEQVQQERAEKNIKRLVAIYQEAELEGQDIELTRFPGIPGEIARMMVGDLRYAMKKKELFMLYQPQVSSEGRVIGAEALLRWRHPAFGLIYPPLIIKLAQEAEFLFELENYIFSWVKERKELYGEMKISVNISGLSLLNQAFIDYLIREFPGGMCGEAKICVEVTERVKVNMDDSRIADSMLRLKNNGFLLAIDDFSMGQTSINYLKNNRFDIVKLDGNLVREIEKDQSSRDIVASLETLAEKMGFSTVAEYVEVDGQREVLKGLGCQIYQGYLYSRPIPVEELLDFTRSLEKSP